MKDSKKDMSELTEQEKSELKVEWLGVDGALVLLYIALACICLLYTSPSPRD